jgi:hypothetical protein
MRHRLTKPRQSISARTIHNFLSRFARGALGPFFLLWCSGTLQITTTWAKKAELQVWKLEL